MALDSASSAGKPAKIAASSNNTGAGNAGAGNAGAGNAGAGMALYGRIVENIETVIKGQRPAIQKLLAAFISGGHVLLEDYPGTGKTTLAKTLVQRGRNEGSIEGMLKRSYESCLVYPLPP